MNFHIRPKGSTLANIHERRFNARAAGQVDRLYSQIETSAGVADPSLFDHSEGITTEKSRQNYHLFGEILNYTRPGNACGLSAHRQLWAREAISRAHSHLILALRLETMSWLESAPKTSLSMNTDCAHTLIDLYRALDNSSTKRVRPCSQMINRVASGLVELFGPSVGHLHLALDVIPISLSWLHRRALVLIVSELITNLINGAFAGRNNGAIFVQLSKCDNTLRLVIDSDGRNVYGEIGGHDISIVTQLAGIFDGELAMLKSNFGGIRFQIDFGQGE